VPLKRVVKLGLLFALVAVVALSGTVWLPWYAIVPGPPRDVEPLISVTGRPEYQSAGRFVMTSVAFNQLTTLGTLAAWLDPHRSVVSKSTVYPSGVTPTQEHRRAISDMDQSKLDAAYVVFSHLLGYPKDHRRGALVEGVVPGCAADGKLYPGDLILSIDRTPVGGSAQASRIIQAAPSGSALNFDIRAGGEDQVVRLIRKPCGGQPKPLVGVSLIPNFPIGVQIQSGDIGGPSAGLMWALGLYDLLTPGDLTGGRTVAGTGQIGLDGKVYPIGGIGDKIVAAERTGADVFLLPKDNYAEAKAASSGGMTLVPVTSFDDALRYLEGASG
jgi:Lon-like protease